ncbi:hypothetical protein M0R79_04725 [Ignavigranum ruoffiae]|nr:hypothetical protein [Ignavigranum ruoffiae]UPQ84987.1 hypothetical protein M0R79_04725 [Ignavigranum ruoffiae]
MKKLLKKLIALGVASLSLSPLVNLVPVASAQEQVLNISTSAEPPTIDPALATDSTSGSILRNVFEGLTVVSPEGEVQPGAAESWEVSDDGLVYTFK